MLKVSSIKKSFSHARILNDITFDAHNAELTVIEGQNGAGKSTLFNIMSGLLTADEGTISVGNIRIDTMPAITRAKFIALLRQDPKNSTVETLSIAENFVLAMLKSKRASLKTTLSEDLLRKIASHVLEHGLDFAHDLHRKMSDLSGGQRQILAFIMATIIKPELILLDEPTAALDEKSSHQLMKLVKNLVTQWNIPAVMISHDRALNREYADVIFELKDGGIVKVA